MPVRTIMARVSAVFAIVAVILIWINVGNRSNYFAPREVNVVVVALSFGHHFTRLSDLKWLEEVVATVFDKTFILSGPEFIIRSHRL